MSGILKDDLNIVIAGHVDHGKSTIIGRLLADTDSLPEGKLEQVKETCRKNSKPFEYAFLLDALKDEQAQGITIDSARCFFETPKRRYIIIDAPGHIEFLKNMITGAARAEAALLVVDAEEGIQENSCRHAYMLSMLGIEQVVVLVNKIDLVDYNQKVFEDIVKEYTKFLKEIDLTPNSFIPVSGMLGDNVASLSRKTSWYQGDTVLEILDKFNTESLPENKDFRMPVQDVYKFTKGGDKRRIVAGKIESGRLNLGDEVVFYPSGKRSKVKSIEAFNEDKKDSIGVGYSTGFTLEEQIYITRGEVATLANQSKPKVSSRVKANIFWLGNKPLSQDKEYYLKLGTTTVKARVESIEKIIDASDLKEQEKNKVEKHAVAECVLKLEKAVAFDLVRDMEATSRFVIVDDYEIAGGGIVGEALEDKQSWVRDMVMLRNYKWEKSHIPFDRRAEKYSQKATLVLITGEEDVGKKPTAKALEKMLFNDGKMVYFLGIGNLLYGVDADIKTKSNNNKEEHLRRLAEVSYLMLDAGAILVVTAIGLAQEDLKLIETTVDKGKIETVWLGENITTDIDYDLHIPEFESFDDAALRVKRLLQDKGAIFRVDF
ncbi:GTP-binding protein [Natroniella sp. ANB-PHB2]|uniref:GTP-binding protein n=1 Tax=Natroniella sp. ANB-PHB2 TaxID=3384444 RepID=UPI0038D495C1